MKTGLVQADPRKTCWKIYKYHGIWLRCRVSCEPDPVIPIPVHKPCPGWPYDTYPPFDVNDPAKDGWVLVYEWHAPPGFKGGFSYRYNIEDFPAGKRVDGCHQTFPDGYKHWYAYDIDMYSCSPYYALSYYMNNYCQRASTWWKIRHGREYGRDGIYAGWPYLFSINCFVYPSYVKFWKNCGKPGVNI